MYLILGAAELQYERVINEDSSFGVRTLFAVSDDVFEYEPFYLDGSYRIFFGEKPASGFFVEGLASYNSVKEFRSNYNSINGNFTQTRETESGFGLGLQVGGKFITRNGIVFELNGGIGRNLISSQEADNRIFGRFAISAGYRF